MAKTSEPSLIDRHIEKFVLGAAALIFLIVLLVSVASSPYQGEIRGTVAEPPNRIDDELSELATQVRGAIGEKKPDIATPPDWLSNFTKRSDEPLGNERAKAVNLTMATAAIEVGSDIESGFPLLAYLPTIPKLEEIGVWTGSELVRQDQGGGMSAALYDEEVVRPTAVLDYEKMVDDWRAALGEVGVPLQEIVFLDVVAERQERLPDGSWGPVQAIPGVKLSQFNARGGSGRQVMPKVPVYDGDNLQEVERVLASFRNGEVQSTILEPEFYPVYWPGLNTFATWRGDLAKTSLSSDAEALVPREHELPPYQEVRPEVVETDRPGADTPRPGGGRRPVIGPSGGGGRGINIGPPGGGGRGDINIGPPGGRGTSYGPGYGPGFGPSPSGREPDRRSRTEEVDPVAAARKAKLREVVPTPTLYRQVSEIGKVQVWVHDVDAEAGKTYQYRLRVDVLNPVFGQPSVTEREQDAKQLAISATSDWSSPIAIPEPTQLFVFGGAKDMGQISFEVYKRVNGQQLQQTFTVRPGQVIGGKTKVKYINPLTNTVVSGEVDFNTGCVMVDADFRDGGAQANVLGQVYGAVVLTRDGQLVARSDETDRQDPLHKKLRQLNSDLKKTIVGPRASR